MKNFAFVIFCLFPWFLQAQDVFSEWLPTKDNTHFRYFDSSTKLYYNVNNDAEHLYFTIKIDDKATQMKMIHAGMVIGLKTKYCNAKIHFPIYKNSENAENKNPGKKQLHQKIEGEDVHIRFENFIRSNGLYHRTKEAPIKVKTEWTANSELLIKIKIPFDEIFDKNISISQKKKAIKFYLEQKSLRGAANTLKGPKDSAIEGSQGSYQTQDDKVYNTKSKSPLFTTFTIKHKIYLKFKD